MLSQQSLLNIFQELPIPIVILFPDFPHFTISETNKSFNETFNIDKDHIIGNKISNYFYTDQNKNNLLKSLKTTADQNIITEVFEFKFDVKGRQTLFFNIKCVPSLSNEGDLQNIVCYFSNINNSNISQLSDKIKPIENNSLDKDKSSEEWYKMLFTLSHLPKWVYDLKTLKILDVNESAIKKYGYTREEFLSLNVKELIPDSEIPEFLKLLKTLEDNTGTINNGILLNKRKDKTTIKVNVLRNKFINNGRSCILVECVDVTEREEALQLLKDNESKYISAQKIAKLGYWELNLKTLELYWSDGVYNIFEVDKKSFKVSLESFYNTIHPEDIKEMRKVNTEAIKGEKELDIKHRIILPDGSVKWVREKAKITKDNNGDFNILEGTVQDINAEKKLELSLEETKSLYEYATKATSDLIWDWDLKTDILFWGDDFKKIFGENFINNLNVSITWIERIHPEDSERILKSVQNSIEGSDLNWSGEYRILKGEQTYIHVLDKGFFLRDSTGKAYRMVGAMQDISERKALETLLEKSNRLAKIGSWEIDVLTDTVYWSDITKEIREADPDFVPHLSLGIEYFKEGKNRETISSRVQNCIKNFTPWDEELQIVTQKGNLKWIRTIGEPEILNGKCVKVFGSFQDIDEKKQSAEKIRLSNERFERVSEASRDAIWDIDLITNTIFLGNGFKNLWGENYINKIYGRENWMNNFYKED
ncbi:MAG: PAS domain-containing protein, partial [Ferruginibacter sp.]